MQGSRPILKGNDYLSILETLHLIARELRLVSHNLRRAQTALDLSNNFRRIKL